MSQIILLTGSSGFLGSAVCRALHTQGARVIKLVRNTAEKITESDCLYWNPDLESTPDLSKISSPFTVIHLAGDNIASGRWTKHKKELLWNSRVTATQNLAAAFIEQNKLPDAVISASAVGFYGDTGDTICDEDSPAGSGFLADMASAWENSLLELTKKNVRVASMRFGMILHPSGGALKKMLPAFKLGLGGKLGRGDQYMSWVGLNDAVEIILEAAREMSEMSGPYNVCNPTPITNAEFTRRLGVYLHRPYLFSVPAIILRLIFGEMADALLLSSCRATSKRLLKDRWLTLEESFRSSRSGL